MDNSADPNPEIGLAVLQDELAEVARATARLLVQPEHDADELLGLDIRAAALRKRIEAARDQARKPEPSDLRRDHHAGARLVSGG